jgi:hypothetical protein
VEVSESEATEEDLGRLKTETLKHYPTFKAMQEKKRDIKMDIALISSSSDEEKIEYVLSKDPGFEKTQT